MLEIIFWVSLSLIAYVYVGYPLGIFLVSRFRCLVAGTTRNHVSSRAQSYLPCLTLIIPAHNEELWIRQKLENTLSADYPRELLQIILASDGSTDRTVGIAHEFAAAGVEVAEFQQRIGKQEMLNRVVPQAKGEILVMTDTHVLLQCDAVRMLVRHFANPRVGCVTGKRLCILQKGVVQGEGEGLYWRYESWIKESESRVHSCLGAHGQLYAVRKDVFPHVAKVGEDFFIPMKILATRKLRVIFEPRAIAMTPAAANLGIELERKTRAHVSFLLTLALLKELWNPRHPAWWQYISHHVLRMAVPVAMLAAFVSSGTLAGSSPFFRFALVVQVFFYAAALIGCLFSKLGKRPKVFYVPFYFVFANFAIVKALLRWPFRKYDYAWKRTERLPVSQN